MTERVYLPPTATNLIFIEFGFDIRPGFYDTEREAGELGIIAAILIREGFKGNPRLAAGLAFNNGAIVGTIKYGNRSGNMLTEPRTTQPLLFYTRPTENYHLNPDGTRKRVA